MAERRDYLTTTTALREDRRRGTVLFATGVLILLATSPVLAHHVGSQLDEILAGRDHLWRICVIAVHQLLAPIHQGFHALLVGGLTYALWDRARTFLSARRLLGAVAMAAPTRGDAFWNAATAADVPPDVVRIVEGLPNPAFTIGWLRPKIFVAAELPSVLSPGELSAVVAHEYGHVRRRDPARLSIMRFVGCAIFWLPALRRLAADAADEAEIAADDGAVRNQPMVLASAILKLAQWRLSDGAPGAFGAALSTESGVVGFNRDVLLDRRIRRLAGEDVPVTSHVNRRSVFVAIVALLLVWSSGMAVAHPLPAGSEHAEHCDHSEWALTHLFCLGSSHVAGEDCPHGRNPAALQHVK